MSVAVYGDIDKPALVTYPDVALNRKFNVSNCLRHGFFLIFSMLFLVLFYFHPHFDSLTHKMSKIADLFLLVSHISHFFTLILGYSSQ